jgi:hypothetical protein
MLRDLLRLSSHPLALGHRGSADSVVRTAVLSLANGTDRFLACWTLHDCEGYWRSQHYGCIGLIGRRPEYNPKPAAPAFATMTQLLDTAKYDGSLPANSPGDNYREKDSVWWSHSAEGVVDLPLKLTKIIVEMPTHQIYVDEILPVDNTMVEFDVLAAVYDSLESQTEMPPLSTGERESIISVGSAPRTVFFCVQAAVRSELENFPVSRASRACLLLKNTGEMPVIRINLKLSVDAT